MLKKESITSRVIKKDVKILDFKLKHDPITTSAPKVSNLTKEINLTKQSYAPRIKPNNNKSKNVNIRKMSIKLITPI